MMLERLKKYLPSIEKGLDELYAGFNHPEELYEPIRYTLNLGGKRLRPILVLMACEVFDSRYEKALSPALGIEVFHNFTLIHDDIMDKAPLRRGKETVYKKWNPNIAILSGDVMFVKAYELLTRVEDEHLKSVIGIFNKTAVEVCEGQQLDMNFEESDNVSIEDYLHMIELKTSVLLAAGLKVGAIIGGATMESANHLYEFGRNIGIAFQLQDDLLDTYADPDIFGKQVGGDIVSNKKTYLVLKALELSHDKGKSDLISLLANDKMENAEKVDKVKKVFDQLNIREHAGQLLDQYNEKAFQHLNELEVEEDKKKPLSDLAKMLLKREK